MLEERIKRASKTRQVVNHNPPPAAVEQPPVENKNNRNTARPGTGLRPPSAASAGAARDNDSEVGCCCTSDDAEQGHFQVKMRYQQARSNSAGRAPAPARPVSGAFTLDLDKIEGRGGLDRLSDSGPKLVEHDLDDIINSDPVMLPITRTGLQQRVGSPETAVGNRGLIHNQEAHQVCCTVHKTDMATLL